MNPQRQSYTRTLRIVPFVNGTGEDIPANGLIELEGSEDDGFTALKPRKDGCFCYINLSNVPIPDGNNGQATSDGPLIIATDGTAAAGETWGAKADSFLANKDYDGFRVMEDGADGSVWADRPSATAVKAAVLVRVTSETADSGGWPGTLYINNGDGTWGTGPDIRVVLSPNTEGTTYYANDWLAVENGTTHVPRTVTDGVTTNGDDEMTSATGAFTADDVGATVTGVGIPADTTIVSVTNSTTVVLSNDATADGTGVSIVVTPVKVYRKFWTVGIREETFDDCDADNNPICVTMGFMAPWRRTVVPCE